MPSVEPQMLKGLLALLLLSLLTAREDYGYSLIQRLRSAGLTDAAEGSVYPALARLEARALLRPRLVQQGRGAARRYYDVTAAGMQELHRLQTSWAAASSIVETVDQVGLDAADPSRLEGA